MLNKSVFLFDAAMLYLRSFTQHSAATFVPLEIVASSLQLYAQTLIVVVLIVVNFFGFLVIAPYPTMRF